MESYANATYFSDDLLNCSLYEDADNGTTACVFGAVGEDKVAADANAALFRNLSRFWVKRVLYPLIVAIGVLGNSITIVILTRRRMRSSTNHYLTALAFSDLFYLMFAFTLTLDDYEATKSYTYYSYWRFALMLTDACSNTSVWLTVTFTIERYVAVCHPIKGKVFCTRSRAKKVIAIVVCTCFFVVLPTPFEWTVVEEVSGVDNVTRVYKTASKLGMDRTYQEVYYRFTSICFVFLPLTLLAIFNSFLIRSVHQSKTQRRRMTMRGRNSDHAHQENRITIMLIAVVIMFLICQLPTAVILVYTSIYTIAHDSTEDAIVRGLGSIFNALVAVNAACNFVLYCAFSDKYRRTFLRTFIPCMYRLASPTHSQSIANATGYSQVDADSGGSFRKATVMSARRKPPGVHIRLKEQHGVNGVHRNGSAARSTAGQRYLQVPVDNGFYSGQCDDSNGSAGTQETVIIIANGDGSNPLVNGKTPTIVVDESVDDTLEKNSPHAQNDDDDKCDEPTSKSDQSDQLL